VRSGGINVVAIWSGRALALTMFRAMSPTKSLSMRNMRHISCGRNLNDAALQRVMACSWRII
jgi:hypothetical protein